MALLGRARIVLALTLFDFLAVLFQNWPFYCASALDMLRNRGLANNLGNRLGRKRSARGSRNHVHLGSFINDDATPRALEIPIDPTNVINDARAIDDRSVIYDDRVRTDRLAEMMNVHEHEQGWRKDCPSGTAGSPTNVIRRFAPRHPGWRPFCARYPAPTVVRIIYPGTIVVRCPGPWLIADPIPAAIGPFPMAFAVGPPTNFDINRVPASAIGADTHPFPVGCQWFVKIVLGTNLDPGRE